MELQVNEHDGIGVVVIADDITTESIQEFSNFIKTNVTPKYTHIVLDMAAVDYFCSSAYGVMLRCLEAARERGGDMVLANASESVHRLFEVTRLTSVVRLEHTLEAALRFLAKKRQAAPSS